jgi:hypothetical protein
VHELVLVLSDFYVSQETPDRELPVGVTLPGLQQLTRFGTRSKLPAGWRPWLGQWLTGADPGAPATVAAASTIVAATPATATAAPATAAVTPTTVAAMPTTVAATSARAAQSDHLCVAWMATPMHLIAGMTSIHVDRRSILRLEPSDQAALADDFQRVFHDSGFHLRTLEAGDFLMLGPPMPVPGAEEPARSLGGSMAQHAGASVAVRRLNAEIEMWLHDHPINDIRRQRGDLPVTSLWLWGAGAVPTSDSVVGGVDATATPPGVVGVAEGGSVVRSADSVETCAGIAGASIGDVGFTRSDSASSANDTLAFGRDSYLQGLWTLRGAKVSPLPQQLADVFSYPHAQRAVLVIEIGVMLQSNPRWTFFEAVADIDRRFIAPALEALNRGQCQRLVVLANDYELTLRASDRWKFWRRAPSGLSGLQ